MKIWADASETESAAASNERKRMLERGRERVEETEMARERGGAGGRAGVGSERGRVYGRKEGRVRDGNESRERGDVVEGDRAKGKREVELAFEGIPSTPT